jgi:hypothetical protein
MFLTASILATMSPEPNTRDPRGFVATWLQPFDPSRVSVIDAGTMHRRSDAQSMPPPKTRSGSLQESSSRPDRPVEADSIAERDVPW